MVLHRELRLTRHMLALIIVLSVIAVAGTVGTIRLAATDGFRRIPTRSY